MCWEKMLRQKVKQGAGKEGGMMREISLLGRAAIIGSQYATDGLLIRPSFQLFVGQSDGETGARAKRKWERE